MKIAVIGGGHGCYAAAADLSEAGHEVRFWRQDAAAFAPVLATGTVRLKDFRGSRDVRIAQPTLDIGQAVHGADLILSPLPAVAQADIARRIAPHLADGQVIFIPPGTLGSVLMLQVIRAAGSTADIAIGEAGTLPWLTRKHGPAEIAVTTRASRLPTGIFPARLSDAALAVIRRAFPACIEPVEDALSAALMNAGPIIHPPLILMNAGPIEHFERWDIHKEGTQPSIRRVHDALDGERIALREALGYRPPHFPLADHYATANWMYGNLAHDKLVGSGDWHETLNLSTHRYMAEDVALGLALLVSIARWAGVPAPTAEGLLQIGGVAAGVDFLRSGRTLATLGLDGLDRAQMADLMAGGI
ncbi:MAG TPA: NAD/NADP octopine/nopaline dehydrogenase family protein [Beijerinckiaceae bacterium]|nr:NAD/NADP octopine/nopaline dehydrogenase family protein [Beijerinckiaceae bacterium]